MEQIGAYLPDEILPKWMLFTSIVAIGNSIQSYTTLHFTSQVYSGCDGAPSPATGLSSRTFGTWTLLASALRLFASYNISDPQWYQLAFLSYIIAWGHFVSEWLVFKSTSFGRGLAGPLIVSTGTLVWMATQWDYYVK